MRIRIAASAATFPMYLLLACSDDSSVADETDAGNTDDAAADSDAASDAVDDTVDPGDTVATDTVATDTITDTEGSADVTPPAPGSCAAADPVSGSFAVPTCGYSVDLLRYMVEALPDCSAPDESADNAPSNVRLTFPRQDAADSLAILWYTPSSSRHTVVEFGTSPDALTQSQTGFSFTYSTLGGARIADDAKRVVHETHLCGLEPATTYYYRVGGGLSWSDVYSFTTAPEQGTDGEFTFAVTGDTRSDTQEIWGQALDRMIGDGAEFLIFTGDAVEAGTNQAEWDVWLDRGQPSDSTDRMATLPLVFANGNHDVGSEAVWANFAQEGIERFATIRYGNAVFIVLNDDPFSMLANGESVDEEGAAYLEAALEANQDATWTFVSHHRAIYSASNHGSQEDLQEAWLPLYDAYEVDMVFNGHDHNYERSQFIRDGAVVGEGSGTVYVVADGIGAPLYDSGSDWWTAYSESVPSYVLVTINGNTLTYTAKRLDGTVIDELSWTKD